MMRFRAPCWGLGTKTWSYDDYKHPSGLDGSGWHPSKDYNDDSTR